MKKLTTVQVTPITQKGAVITLSNVRLSVVQLRMK